MPRLGVYQGPAQVSSFFFPKDPLSARLGPSPFKGKRSICEKVGSSEEQGKVIAQWFYFIGYHKQTN